MKSLRISLRITAPGGSDTIQGWASVGVGDVAFRVPEPGSAALLATALAGLALLRRIRR